MTWRQNAEMALDKVDDGFCKIARKTKGCFQRLIRTIGGPFTIKYNGKSYFYLLQPILNRVTG
jgi:hypothetical protein